MHTHPGILKKNSHYLAATAGQVRHDPDFKLGIQSGHVLRVARLHQGFRRPNLPMRPVPPVAFGPVLVGHAAGAAPAEQRGDDHSGHGRW